MGLAHLMVSIPGRNNPKQVRYKNQLQPGAETLDTFAKKNLLNI
jgi:hypothetical protein